MRERLRKHRDGFVHQDCRALNVGFFSLRVVGNLHAFEIAAAIGIAHIPGAARIILTGLVERRLVDTAIFNRARDKVFQRSLFLVERCLQIGNLLLGIVHKILHLVGRFNALGAMTRQAVLKAFLMLERGGREVVRLVLVAILIGFLSRMAVDTRHAKLLVNASLEDFDLWVVCLERLKASFLVGYKLITVFKRRFQK